VIIVGAGPVGLTLALELARLEVPSVVLSAGTQRCEGSRAIALHRSALAFWEPLGVTSHIVREGVAWRVRRTFYRTHELHALELPAPVQGIPLWINLPQSQLEDLLLARVTASGLIDLRWQHEVTGVAQDDTGVRLAVQTDPAGLRAQFSASYVVACDGARSAMRTLLGLDFPGYSAGAQFLITDVRADVDWAPEPHFYFDHPTHRRSTMLIHPQPDGVWRIDWRMGEYLPPGGVLGLMHTKLSDLLHYQPYRVLWHSVYRFHQRLLPELMHGRVAFAGDAAHLVAPFGARGLNSGIQDVAVLAPRLAHVIHRRLAPGALRSYTTQRMPDLIADQEAVAATMRFMAPHGFAQRARQRTILELADRWQFARPWVDSGRMYTGLSSA
jgi:3-(3-hydroxy-phenyl)propionate hydroxylase